ncbi:NineTeen Complex (NTC) component [Coemansia erecta]|uniref:NineTeen Complex (NTC) component n=1 Tax=Coemansia erecta TaxID=147472 RepID=A0A9W7Y303_9FUNG|nr:NineTeen Complex (NTC) component [Coemansia erecta]
MADAGMPGGYGQSGRPPKIKNKNAAAVQITAEQLIREAYERQGSGAQQAPRQKVLDGEELGDYQQRRRREFEEGVRKKRHDTGEWVRYAAWEEGQGEVARARSIYERALEVDGRSQTLYLKYAELEAKSKNVNSARNVYERAITVLPRVAQFWFRYAYMEEVLGNVMGAREVFDRWMQWEPAEDAWMAYVKLEKRYGEAERVRGVFERMVHVHPQPSAWLRWAAFEEEQGDVEQVRQVFGQAIDRLGSEFLDQHVFLAFARFETRQDEVERARAIYRYALARLPRARSLALYRQYVLFEKQYGGREQIEEVVAAGRRAEYERGVREDPGDYDAWLEYARLEESAIDGGAEGGGGSADALERDARVERARDVYERAIAQTPGTAEKQLWRRYIYVWLHYALFEETLGLSPERARQVYQQCTRLVPHTRFTFAKLWLQHAWFLVRQLDLGGARRLLGQALGMCPKRRLFRGYVELEIELREFDRVRRLYARQLEWDAGCAVAWVEFARLEEALGEHERCRALYQAAVEQPVLDTPEVVWKAFVDFEVAQGERDRARALYERLLGISGHVRVWLSWARMERSLGEKEEAAEEEEAVERARGVYRRADAQMKQAGRRDERAAVLAAWREMEAEAGRLGDVGAVERLAPRRVRRRRVAQDGALEEYFDLVFPDDDGDADGLGGARLKLLARAQQWKQRVGPGSGPESGSDSDDDGEEDGVE